MAIAPPFARSALSLTFAVAGVLAASCRTGSDSAPAPAEDVPTFRLAEGDPPPFLPEVDQLRAQGISLTPSAEVGAIPTNSGVDAKGNATLSLPIDVAPGPRGMAPSLSLDYASNEGSGNGYLGVGFSLSGLGSVRRCTKNLDIDGAWGAVELDNDDALCWDGMRLVLAAGSYGQDGSEYRTLRDSFAKIVLHGAIGQFDSWFEIFHKDGTISHYGRVEATLAREAEGGERIPYAWGLRERLDRFGNAIHYAYDLASLVDASFAELFPVEISYGGTGTVQSRRRITFVPEARVDDVSGYFVGGRYGHDKRIAHINVEGPDGELMFSYGLDYEGDQADGNFLTRRSRLVRVTKCDRFGRCLPPTEIEWNVASGDENFVVYRNKIAYSNYDGGGPDPESPASVAVRDAQILLTQATHQLVGDFDGNLEQEALFWTFDGSQPDDVSSVHIWQGDATGYDDDGTPLTPYATALVPPFSRIPGPSDILDGVSEPESRQHRIHGGFNYSVVNTTDDGLSDVLVPMRGPGDGYDAHGVPYAHGFRILLGHGLGDFDWTTPDDGASGHIYQMVPTDHDGDGLTDVWLCRGAGYKTGTWELAHRDTELPVGSLFTFWNTGVGCSSHDEIQLMSLRGGPPSLLVVPAYGTDPAFQLDPSDPEYTSGYNKISEAQRTEYLELRYTIGGSGELVSSGLPRDVYQRWHDQNCNNGYAATADQPPVWGAGLGQDKLLDVNGDGLMDVLRFELASGDDPTNPLITGPGFPDSEDWYDGDIECKPDIGTVEGGQIVLYVNTGVGFTTGEVVHTFDGSAHANYALNFIGAMLHDGNEDGLLDLFMPSAGKDSSKQWALIVADGVGGMYDPGFTAPFNFYANDGGCTIEGFGTPCIWPAYRQDADWMDQIALKNASRILMPRTTGTGPGITFLGPAAWYMYRLDPDEENWLPHPQWVIAEWDSRSAWPFDPDYGRGHLRVTRVTDGLGAEVDFGYQLNFLSGSATYPNGPRSRPAVVVARHRINGTGIPCGDPGGDCLTTSYEYGGAVVDRLGGGFLGFNRVTASTEGGRTTIAEYEFERDPDVPGFPYAGMPARHTERAVLDDGNGGQESHLVCTTQEWTLSTSTLPGGVSYFAYPHEVRRVSAVVPGDQADCDDIQSLHRYSEQIDTQLLDAYGTPKTQSTTITGGETTTTTFGDILNDTTNWIIGHPGDVSVESCTAGGYCRIRTARNTYDPVTGEVVSIVRQPGDPLYEQETTLGYNPTHGGLELVQVIADGEVRSTATAWDAEGVSPVSRTNADGHTSHLVHDPASGVRYAAIDPNGVTSYIAFDAMLRPVLAELRSSPVGPHDGNPVTTSYEPGLIGEPWSAMRIRMAEATGQIVTADHDPAGRLTQRTWRGMADASEIPPGTTIPAGEDIYQTYHYDGLGRRTSVSLPAWVSEMPAGYTVRTYDALDRVLTEVAANGATDRWAYDASGVMLDGYPGSRVTHTDPDNNAYATLYDPQGRVVRADEPAVDGVSGKTCWTYTAFSQVETHTRNCQAANGPQPQTVYKYDLMGRLEDEVDTATGARSMTYTGFDELDTLTDPNEAVTDFDYDSLGRVVRRTQPDGTASFIYDTVWIGALTTSLNSLGGVRRTYGYDAFGRVKSEQTRATVAGVVQSPTFRYVYGPGGRLEQVVYPKPSGVAGFSVSHLYDGAGYARSVRDDTTGVILWQLDRADEASQPRAERFGNGVDTSRHFNPLSLRPDGIETWAGGKPLQQLTYKWTQAGDLEFRYDDVHNQGEEFKYDELHRLRETTAPWGTVGVDYDVLGNITYKSDVGPYAYDGNGMLEWVKSSAFVVDHDKAGQVIRWGGANLTWTVAGQVRTVGNAAGTRTMTYSAEGDRVLTYDSGNDRSVLTVGDGYEMRFDKDTPVDWVQRVAAPTGRIVAQRTQTLGVGGTVITQYGYLHDDHLGSTNVISPVDGPEEKSVHVSNDPWGQARSGESWDKPFEGELSDVGVGFTGHRAELDKGLTYMRGRMYDAWAARFMSPDPIVVDPRSVQAWNPYSYVLNRPLVFTDPSGFAPEGDCDVDICGDDHPVDGKAPADVSGSSAGGGAGEFGIGLVDAVWAWGGINQVINLWNITAPGMAVTVQRAMTHHRAMNPIGGPNPYGDHAYQGPRPRIPKYDQAPDPDCTGTCAYSKTFDLPYGRELSPEYIAQSNADHIEHMNNSPGAKAAKLTMAILTAGDLALAFEGVIAALSHRGAQKALAGGAARAAPMLGRTGGDLLAKYGPRVAAQSGGRFNVVTHADATSAWVLRGGDWIKVSHRSLAQFIQKMPGYKGQPLRIVGCNAGSCATGLGQNLANKLGVSVEAATSDVLVHSNGTFTATGWRVFTPGL